MFGGEVGDAGNVRGRAEDHHQDAGHHAGRERRCRPGRASPGRNRPVGKISSSAAMPRGRTAPNRSRNHSARLAPGVGMPPAGPRTARRTGRNRPTPRPRRSGAGPSRSAAAGRRGRRRARRARWPDRPRCRRRRILGPSSMPGPSSGAATSRTTRRRPGAGWPRPAPRRRPGPLRWARRRPDIVDAGPPASVDRAHQWSYRTTSPDQTSAER